MGNVVGMSISEDKAKGRISLEKGDYFELQTMFLRQQMAMAEAVRLQTAMKQKLKALAEAKQFDPDVDWIFDDVTCSLVTRG